ncbi:Succinyl-CoA ligase [ADP-forming] subunit beta [Candidatus Annandia adelgestsuga]|uniref:Succinyl-CoA ligase [ADP-forming] subunit beta n=1 Tax=Candidatus Annandia adelgestsuga TaxID=1302411 RepID=A0A3Q9CL73_9ENTR|nr:ADP-forming succinate--CoA ligase subunit beta [Candidatus Annandia adelgestsuga]AZP36144.1 Succinyl-CoA ligase [ADP-forming] subunit beta [Candidatus Annandia adelgestsuga]
MKFHEYQAKEIFKKYKLPIPKGYLFNNYFKIKKFISKINFDKPVIAKCQAHTGGRGKVGGIKIIKNYKDIKLFFKYWFNKKIKTSQNNNESQIIKNILIEEYINISKELYLSILIDNFTNCIFFMFSNQGGIEIEKIIKKYPYLLKKIKIDPLIGPQFYQIKKILFELKFNKKQIEQFNNIFFNLYKILIKFDLTLIEINPLVIDKNDNLICLDIKLILDKNSIFRQSLLKNIYDYSQNNDIILEKTFSSLNYILLKGNIGCMINGAGLAMSTMDLLKLYGGKPANFLDIGGRTNTNNIVKSFNIILSNKNVNVIFINIFGGIIRCDFIANSIIYVLKKIKINIPIVIRLSGNNSKIGINKLLKNKSKIITITNLKKAIKFTVFLSKNKRLI